MSSRAEGSSDSYGHPGRLGVEIAPSPMRLRDLPLIAVRATGFRTVPSVHYATANLPQLSHNPPAEIDLAHERLLTGAIVGRRLAGRLSRRSSCSAPPTATFRVTRFTLGCSFWRQASLPKWLGLFPFAPAKVREPSGHGGSSVLRCAQVAAACTFRVCPGVAVDGLILEDRLRPAVRRRGQLRSACWPCYGWLKP